MDEQIPLARKYGHIYIEWAVIVAFATTELRKIHRYFHRPQPRSV